MYQGRAYSRQLMVSVLRRYTRAVWYSLSPFRCTLIHYNLRHFIHCIHWTNRTVWVLSFRSIQ